MTSQDLVASSDQQDSPAWTTRVIRWTVWAMLTGAIVYLTLVINGERAKVRDANERLFRIVHGSPIATIMCDEDAKIVEFNRAAEELLSWTRTEMLGKDVNVMIAQSNREEHRKSFDKAIGILKSVDEDWRVTKTGLKGTALDKWGKEVKVEFATRGIRYGEKIEFLAFLRKDVPPPTVPKIEAGPLELPKKIVP